MTQKKRVAVVFGGQSTEHDISKISAQYVINNIDREKFDVVMFGITRDGKWLNYDGPTDLLKGPEWQEIAESQNNGEDTSPSIILKNNIDVVFPVLHGCNGEDGTIQGLFEILGMAYVGSGVLGSAICMDKAYTKIIFDKEGLPQGKYIVFSRKEIQTDTKILIKKVEDLLSYPCFVKPSKAGSSVGVSKACTSAELAEALIKAAKYDNRILVEEFIDGREIECAILGNEEPQASVLGEILPGNDFYDFDAKYLNENSSTLINADLPSATAEKIKNYALTAYKASDCAGLARVDFFVHKVTGEIFINEINTMPGFTSISMYPKLWEASGISCKELLDRLISLAFERQHDCLRELY